MAVYRRLIGIGIAVAIAGCTPAVPGTAEPIATLPASTSLPATPAGTAIPATPAPTVIPTPAPQPSLSAACTSAVTVETGDRTIALTVDGVARSALVHVPKGLKAGAPAALALSLHGTYSDPADQAWVSGFSAVADENHFIVAYPAGLGEPTTWDYRDLPDAPDDVAFVVALLDRLGQDLCLAKRRIVATGFSAGGAFAKVLACALPERFAAIALVSPVLGPGFGDCRQPAPVPTLVFFGLLDPLLPYRGGLNPLAGFEDWPPTIGVEDWAAGWAAGNGCAGRPWLRSRSAGRRSSGRQGCIAPLVLWRFGEAGHSWPGGNGFEAFGKINRDISASEQAWSFFVANED